jgi:hypothetical protein
MKRTSGLQIRRMTLKKYLLKRKNIFKTLLNLSALLFRYNFMQDKDSPIICSPQLVISSYCCMPQGIL